MISSGNELGEGALFTPFSKQFLEGAKVCLRPFRVSDITPTYLGWLNDPKVVRYSNQRFHLQTMETSLQYLSTFAESTNYFLAICGLEDKVMVGTMTIYRNLNHGTADIGILVGDPTTWGRGLGLDAFCTVAKSLEQSGQIRKLTAGAMAANKGMVNILERAGFTLEAVRRGQEMLEGKPVDILYYARFSHV